MCRTSLHTADKTGVKRCPRQDNNRPKKPQGGIPRNTGDAEDDALHDDDFMMYCLKVIPCKKTVPHEWSVCPFAHQGEGAVRRDLRTHYYTGVVCPDMKKNGFCMRGDECPFAHCVFEYWLHPTRYRTIMCTEGDKCMRTFCFFAHSPEQLRQRELAELRKPSRQRRQEATLHQTRPPADTTAKDQAPEAIINNLTGTMTAQPDAFKTPLQVTQGGSLPAHGQHVPARGDSLSTYIPDPQGFIGKPCIKPQQVGMQAPGIGSYSGTVAVTDWQGNPISTDGTAPLAQVQVAAYLAGMAHALGQRAEAARPPQPPLGPQPQLNQHLQVPSLPIPLLHALAQLPPHQQPALYGTPLIAQAGAADLHPPHSLQQRHDQLPGASWVGGTESCSSGFAAVEVSDFPSLQGAPLPTSFSPAVHLTSILPPDNHFRNNSLGAPNPLQMNQVDAANPFTAESRRLPFDCIGTSAHMQWNGAVHDWSSGSTNSFMEARCNFTEAPSAELDLMVGSQAASPFNLGEGLDKTPSMQSDSYPEFLPF
ncbi:g5194 [Coccomyxa elongata]